MTVNDWIGQLQTPNREEAVQELIKIGTPAGIALLYASFLFNQDEKYDACDAAIHALHNIAFFGTEKYIAPLTLHQWKAWRIWAANTLGWAIHPMPDDLVVLIAGFLKAGNHAKIAAAIFLDGTDNPLAVSVLLDALAEYPRERWAIMTEDEVKTCDAVLSSLQDYQDARAVPVLAEFLDHPNTTVVFHAAPGLRSIGEPAGESIRVAVEKALIGLRETRQPLRELELLGILGTADCTTAVAIRACDPDTTVRASAIRALGSLPLKPEQAVTVAEMLLEGIGDPERDVRLAAIQRLTKEHVEAAVAHMCSGRGIPDAEARSIVIAPLVRALDDEDNSIRVAATYSLEKHKSVQVVGLSTDVLEGANLNRPTGEAEVAAISSSASETTDSPVSSATASAEIPAAAEMDGAEAAPAIAQYADAGSGDYTPLLESEIPDERMMQAFLSTLDVTNALRYQTQALSERLGRVLQNALDTGKIDSDQHWDLLLIKAFEYCDDGDGPIIFHDRWMMAKRRERPGVQNMMYRHELQESRETLEAEGFHALKSILREERHFLLPHFMTAHNWSASQFAPPTQQGTDADWRKHTDAPLWTIPLTVRNEFANSAVGSIRDREEAMDPQSPMGRFLWMYTNNVLRAAQEHAFTMKVGMRDENNNIGAKPSARTYFGKFIEWMGRDVVQDQAIEPAAKQVLLGRLAEMAKPKDEPIQLGENQTLQDWLHQRAKQLQLPAVETVNEKEVKNNVPQAAGQSAFSKWLPFMRMATRPVMMMQTAKDFFPDKRVDELTREERDWVAQDVHERMFNNEWNQIHVSGLRIHPDGTPVRDDKGAITSLDERKPVTADRARPYTEPERDLFRQQINKQYPPELRKVDPEAKAAWRAAWVKRLPDPYYLLVRQEMDHLAQGYADFHGRPYDTSRNGTGIPSRGVPGQPYNPDQPVPPGDPSIGLSQPVHPAGANRPVYNQGMRNVLTTGVSPYGWNPTSKKDGGLIKSEVIFPDPMHHLSDFKYQRGETEEGGGSGGKRPGAGRRKTTQPDLVSSGSDRDIKPYLVANAHGQNSDIRNSVSKNL